MRGSLNFLMRVTFIALGVGLAAQIVRGIECEDAGTLVVVAVLLGLFNAFLKPVLVLATLPFVVLTAGLGLWAINAFILWVAGKLVDGFEVRGLFAALAGSLIVSLTSLVLSVFFGPKAAPRPRRDPPGRPPPGEGPVIDV